MSSVGILVWRGADSNSLVVVSFTLCVREKAGMYVCHTYDMDQVNDALDKVRNNEARYRMVLEMDA
jgi:D-arabinose 1-dehydrogenase-like Zn-dependent alcohol dehydrogenase